MPTKTSAPVAAAKIKLLARISAAQTLATSVKKAAKKAKADFKQAKAKFKEAKRTAKKQRKQVKALKAELAALAAKMPAPKKAAAKRPRTESTVAPAVTMTELTIVTPATDVGITSPATEPAP